MKPAMVGIYVVLLVMTFLSVLSLAFALAFQLFILSCLVLIGVFYIKASNEDVPEDDEPQTEFEKWQQEHRSHIDRHYQRHKEWYEDS